MILYPAIDIRGGRCVRLFQGDYERETIFDVDPADAAQQWADAGARWLHIVDLDAARTGEPVNLEALARIRDAVDIPIQLGGGIRTESHIAAMLDRGINRVILGTVALKNRPLVADAAKRWGAAIAVGLDARDGKLAASGWIEQTEVDALSLAREMNSAGVQTFIFTDIKRDGTFEGPNVMALRQMVLEVDGNVISAGGVGSLEHLDAIELTGASGAIIGRALYDGRVDLRAATTRFGNRGVQA
ncbi:1-(5-phosphoribosyl)-5-[(5-phosphoribosylamino)methylideneamino]imidazole-4-carboxamide isomerase [soil metagenome]